MKTKQTKEIAKTKIAENQDLVITLVDNERLDIRVWLRSERYTGPTKQGVRFYIHEGVWEKFFEAMKKVDEEYQKSLKSNAKVKPFAKVYSCYGL